MTTEDARNDADAMVDAFHDDLFYMERAQRMMMTMQEHHPDIKREEAIIGMLACALGRIPEETHNRFSPSVQALSAEWTAFCDTANGGRAPYTLSPPMTRILKTIYLMRMEDALLKPEPNDRSGLNEEFWDLHHVLHKTERLSAWFGPSECAVLDMVYDENILQITARRDNASARSAELDRQDKNGPPPGPKP